MGCLCKTQALRKFIHTFTQLDVFSPGSAIQIIKFNHFQKTLIPGSYLQPNNQYQFKSYYLKMYRKPSYQKCKTNQQSRISDSTKMLSETQNNLDSDFDDVVNKFSSESMDRLARELEIKEGKNQPSCIDSGQNRVEFIGKNSQDKDKGRTPLMDLLEDASKGNYSDSGTRISCKSNQKEPLKSLSKMSSSNSKAVLVKKAINSPKEPWIMEKKRVKEKYPDGYRPLKRLSPDAMEGIRALHAQMPEYFTTAFLAKSFKISPEAIRRLLKSKWRPNIDEAKEREIRWFKRGEQIWSRWAELGATPPKKFRRLGIGEKTPKYQYKPDPLPQLITTSAKHDKNDS